MGAIKEREIFRLEERKDIIREIPKGLLKWYRFRAGSRALYIGAETDSMGEFLMEQKLQVTTVSLKESGDPLWIKSHQGQFDYMVCIEMLELSHDPAGLLTAWKGLLRQDGHLLLGMNNRLGLRYFCGDHDPYTERNFDGVEGYVRAYARQEDHFYGRCYSQAEIRDMLRAAGYEAYKMYSVLPDLTHPQLIYGEDYLPKEELGSRLFPVYHYPDAVFLEEAALYTSLAQNGMFHSMANAYLIDCGPEDALGDVRHVTLSMERGREYAVLTTIRNHDRVEKRAVYQEGQGRMERMIEYGEDLRDHGLHVVSGRMEDGVYVMPYIEAETAQVYLKKLLLCDKDKFIREMDRFMDRLLCSSDSVPCVENEDTGIILKKGYLDLVPLNCFYVEGMYVFFDQEFCEVDYPVKAIMYRALGTFYFGNPSLQKILPIETLLGRYGLQKELKRWQRMEGEFLERLRKEKELQGYHQRCRCKGEVLHTNRQHMNYSAKEYDRLFEDIFHNAKKRKLILFGAGAFAKKFLALYKDDYPVYAIIDNDEKKWGTELEGILIKPPSLLMELRTGEYKVIVCIKNYMSTMKQLKEMKVTEYSIYDTDKKYPKKPYRQGMEGLSSQVRELPKKYHIGYISGVFDLFHVGHLNLFKRAKELCDYLIVGVVSDEGVSKYKQTKAYIPFEERIEIVRSCRYVDEAVKIPLDFNSPKDALQLYDFDCQFSGSDHEDNPYWLEHKEYLEQNGAAMVFFPYTEGTSSSKLKALIEMELNLR